MFVLDTNVVSELMRLAPEPAVASWVAGRATVSLFLTAIGEAELRFGLAVMPPGRRREILASDVLLMLRVFRQSDSALLQLTRGTWSRASASDLSWMVPSTRVPPQWSDVQHARAGPKARR